MKKIFYLFFLCSFHQIFAQELLFENPSVNVGKIKKDTVPFQYAFKFKVRHKAVQILAVQADCSCAVASFSKDTLSPNQTHQIVVEYSPYRSGIFEKKFVVKTSYDTYTLSLSGTVLPFDIEMDYLYPNKVGELQFKTKKIHFGTLSNEQIARLEIEVWNSAKYDIVMKDSFELPKHLEINLGNRIFPAQTVKPILIYYNTILKNDFGYVEDVLKLFSDSAKVYPLIITSIIKQGFDTLPEKPKFAIVSSYSDLSNVNLGTLVWNENPSFRITIQNNGNSKLILHKIQSSEGVKIQNLQTNSILPNQNLELVFRIDDIGKTGWQQRNIQIFTNDAEKPIQNIYLKFKTN